MRLGQIWRYPVKSMAGEQLDQAVLGDDGVPGDRLVQVFDGRRFVTARSRHRLLGLHATLSDDGVALVDGVPWDAEEVAAKVQEAAGPDARLVDYPGPERFDVLPLLVATDGAIAAFGEDGRRLRPNLVVTGVAGLAERDWPGRRLRIGAAVVGVDSLRSRCIMTTYHPDTLEQDREVLGRIRRDFGGRLALNCWVEVPGVVREGDQVELLDGEGASG
jgi:uncharacterized protein YcbX